MKKRDEFNKMLRLCYRDKIDMIIVKSISRFARNTLDVIKITRKLREINVDVYFEEQGIHSIDPASEFYITIYGSIALIINVRRLHKLTFCNDMTDIFRAIHTELSCFTVDLL
jgi:resolvase domain protein